MNAPTRSRSLALNEIGRWVVDLGLQSQSFCWPASRNYVGLRLLEGSRDECLQIINPQLGLNAFHEEDLMAQLCVDHACMTVDQQLLVDGHAITPESYLELWSASLKQPVAVADLHRHGIGLEIHMQAHVAELRQRNTQFISLFAVYEEFEAALQHLRVPADDGMHAYVCDLANPDVPDPRRIAEDFGHYHRKGDVSYGLALRVKRLGAPAQPAAQKPATTAPPPAKFVFPWQ